VDNEVYDKIHAVEDSLWFYVARRVIVHSLIKTYHPFPVLKYLDIGCGTGGMMKALEPDTRLSIGMDVSYKALMYSQGKNLRCLFQGDACQLGLPDNTFDLVTALDVLEHCEDDVGVLAEIYRVLTPGGFCCLTVPALMILWSNLDRVAHHWRRYTTWELHAKASKIGFQIHKLSYANTWLFPAILVMRLLQRLVQTPDSGASQLDFTMPSQWVNRLLTAIFASEARWLAVANLPIGSSVVAVLQKPSNS
jgi:ubiquinone/menaquinone biosynthesis C-methylase UbiE